MIAEIGDGIISDKDLVLLAAMLNRTVTVAGEATRFVHKLASAKVQEVAIEDIDGVNLRVCLVRLAFP